MAMSPYPTEILLNTPHRSSARKTADESSRFRHPQYKRANESAAQRGRAITAQVNVLVASINGSVHPDAEDNDWAMVTVAPSSSPTDSGASDSSAATPIQELTATNVQLFNMMNDVSAVSAVHERIWLRETNAQGEDNTAVALRSGHPATRCSSGNSIELLEPWGTATMSGLYDSDVFAVGAWATEATNT